MALESADQDGGIPVYLDGFAYGGILNVQVVNQVWPATTGIGEVQHQILGALMKQSNEEPEEDKDALGVTEVLEVIANAKEIELK